MWLTPSEVTNLDQLATALAPTGRCSSLRPDEVPVQVTVGEFGWKLGGQPALRRAAPNEAIADGLLEGQNGDADVLRCRDDLADLGYVWNPPDADDLWQPGVPSLMEYVCHHA